MNSKNLCIFITLLTASNLQGKAFSHSKHFLRLNHVTTCTYDYEVSVNTATGAKSIASEGYHIHALVSYNTFKTSMANEL